MFSIYNSGSTKSSCRPLDLEPLKHSIAERTMAKDTLALIQEIALEQRSPFLFGTNSTSLLWYLSHSSAIPPVVVKTREVNVPCSISITLSQENAFEAVPRRIFIRTF